MDLQNSKDKLLNLVFFKYCSIVVLKLEVFKNTKSFDYFFSTQEQEHATFSLTYKAEFTGKILWNSDQNLWSTSDLKFKFRNR